MEILTYLFFNQELTNKTPLPLGIFLHFVVYDSRQKKTHWEFIKRNLEIDLILAASKVELI